MPQGILEDDQRQSPTYTLTVVPNDPKPVNLSYLRGSRSGQTHEFTSPESKPAKTALTDEAAHVGLETADGNILT